MCHSQCLETANAITSRSTETFSYWILGIALTCVAVYYFLVSRFVKAHVSKDVKSIFAYRGRLDIGTAILFCALSLSTISSMLYVGLAKQMTLQLLSIYYAVLVFLFAIIYALWEWHFPGSLHFEVSMKDRKAVITEGVEAESDASKKKKLYQQEWDSLLLSLHIQTGVGFGRIQSRSRWVDLIAGLQAVLTLFFVSVAVARLLNHLA